MKLNGKEDLIRKAKEIAVVRKPYDVTTGEVGCALLSEKGNIYLGVSIDAACGIGFCAEHSTIANMILNGDYVIKKIVAVSSDGIILPHVADAGNLCIR